MLDATRTLVPQSLEWWLARLGKRLDDRRLIELDIVGQDGDGVIGA